MTQRRDSSNSFGSGGTGSFTGLNLLRCVYSFEEIDSSLPYMPLAARRVLDETGHKLSLEGWLSLELADKKVFLLAGTSEIIDTDVVGAVLSRARPGAITTSPIPPQPESAAPREVIEALGPERPLTDERWSILRPLERYIFVKLSPKPQRLEAAYDEIVGPRLTHTDAGGEARMVDVGVKAPTARRAVATARIVASQSTLDRLMTGDLPKGDVLAVARIAGIQAAKRTHELIPLCHAVALTKASVQFAFERSSSAIVITASAEAVDRTGVEMEAMVAASTAALTIYDMVKAIDRWMTIENVRLMEKTGGASGDLRRPRESKFR